MSFPWRRLFQSIQDDIEGLGDAVFGDRTERLLDDEIRGVDELLHNTRNEYAAAKARRIDAQQRAQRLKADVRAAEAIVEAQLKRRRRTAAREAAAHVVCLQAQLVEMQVDATEMEVQETRFAQLQSQLAHRLRRLKHQLDTHRATASLQRAQATVARRQPGGVPYPEPAPASARRMRSHTRPDAGETPVVTDTAGSASNATGDDPVAEVIQRIAKRIKPRPTTNTPSTEQARRR